MTSPIQSLILSLVGLCLILGISNIVWFLLYENARTKLKHYTIFYSLPSNKRQIVAKVPANNTSSTISAMGIFARIWTLAKSALMPSIKALSISGFTKKVRTSEKSNLIHDTKVILIKIKSKCKVKINGIKGDE